MIQEEIADLSGYLEGVPREFRATGALRSYEARLEALERELLVAMLLEIVPEQERERLTFDLNIIRHEGPADAVAASITSIETSMKQRIRREMRWRNLLNFGALVASFVGLIASFVSLSGAIPFIFLAPAAVMVVNIFSRFEERAVESQRLLQRLSNVRALAVLSAGDDGDPALHARYLTAFLNDTGKETRRSSVDPVA